MMKLFYIMILVLIIAWSLGFVGYTTGSIVIILITVTIVAVLLKVVQIKKPFNKKPFKKRSHIINH